MKTNIKKSKKSKKKTTTTKYIHYKEINVKKGDPKDETYHVTFLEHISDKIRTKTKSNDIELNELEKNHYLIEYNDEIEEITVITTNQITNEDARKIGGLCTRKGKTKQKDVVFNIPLFLKDKTQYIVEGAILSNFCFDVFKSCKNKSIQIYVNGEADKNGMKKGIIYANAQNLVRWLNEYPPNVLKPKDVANVVKSLAKAYQWKVKIYNKKQLENMGMGGIINVGKGSNNANPTLIEIEYDEYKANRLNKSKIKKQKVKHLALVGKGVMFDAGGISLKPSKGMEAMKYDKTGAMVVIGSLVSASKMKYPIKITALIPLVENLPSANAQRPSDIIRAYNGKTIEVVNTDAEGRLILADALAFASEKKPDLIIDLATLTGAIMIALGTDAIGMFGTDEYAMEIINKAGWETYERVWQMPVWDEYKNMIESYIADVKNIGSEKGYAGSITAAMFLKEFVGKTPWVHLDIAGMMNYPSPIEYMDRGARGTPVRLIAQTIEYLLQNNEMVQK